MARIVDVLRAIPLWCRATAVIALGIALTVWFMAEATRRMDERFLLSEVRAGAQRSTDLLSGLLAGAVLAGNANEAEAIVQQYTSGWPDITLVHITAENARVLLEWKRRPIVFGEGILKFESPVRHGGESFGILSLYVDLGDALSEIHEHVEEIGRRNALALLAMMLLITAIVNFVAMYPVKQVSDEVFRLMQVAGGEETRGVGPDEISRLRNAVSLLQKSLEVSRNRGRMVERTREQLRAILNTVNEALLTISETSVIIGANPAAERLWGYGRGELNGKRLEDLMPARYRDRHHEGMQRYLAERKSRIVGQRVRMEALHRDGHEFPVELNVAETPIDNQLLFTASVRAV